MLRTPDPSASAVTTVSADAPGGPTDEAIRHERRNSVWIALHQVFIRIGWIFKAESVIVPYFMDAVGGGPVLRGALMVINRLGFSVPPALFASTLNRISKKRLAVLLTSLGMAAPLLVLAVVWGMGWGRTERGAPTAWMPYLYLAVYGVLFIFTGLHQLSLHALGGKLIRADHRGRLLTYGLAIGSPIAVVCAWFLMPLWLNTPDGGFEWLFAATAGCFVVASLMQLGVAESSDGYHEPVTGVAERFKDAIATATQPGPRRRAAILAMLFSTTFMLFPHYQTLARRTVENVAFDGFRPGILMEWTVLKYASVAVLSLIAGPLADRFGNRLALRFCIFGAATAPISALLLLVAPSGVSSHLADLIFVPLGFTPVTIRLLMNYAIELSPPRLSTRYVSAVGLCLAMPAIIGSPLIGLLIRHYGFAPAYLFGAMVLLLAGLLTFWLWEPRRGVR